MNFDKWHWKLVKQVIKISKIEQISMKEIRTRVNQSHLKVFLKTEIENGQSLTVANLSTMEICKIFVLEDHVFCESKNYCFIVLFDPVMSHFIFATVKADNFWDIWETLYSVVKSFLKWKPLHVFCSSDKNKITISTSRSQEKKFPKLRSSRKTTFSARVKMKNQQVSRDLKN